MERVTVRIGIGIDGGGIFTKVCVGDCLREIYVRNTRTLLWGYLLFLFLIFLQKVMKMS